MSDDDDGKDKDKNKGKRPSGQFNKQKNVASGFTYHTEGDPPPVFANAISVLLHEPQFGDHFSFNQLTLMLMLNKPLPGQPAEGVWPRPLTENDVAHVQLMLQHGNLTRIGENTTRRAVEYVAHRHAYHPIRDWLASLKWTGTTRLFEWMPKCLGAEDTEIARQAGMLFPSAMVARVMRPGCKSDYTLVLEGPQGILKSSVCRILAGEEYFSDHLPPLHADPVRVSQHMRGKWLIEIAELASLLRARPEEVKSFLTRAEEIYTPKFARTEVREPRQCAFIGTTNEYGWSADHTGLRRFWPIIPGKIELNMLEDWREQIFAEAYCRVQIEGKHWWPEPKTEEIHFLPEQQERYDEDLWTPLVLDYLEPRDTVAIDDIALGPLEIPRERLSPLVKGRISAILRVAGWKPNPRHGGKRIWRPS